MKQASHLTQVQVSDFWKKLSVIQKINYTAKQLLDNLSTHKLLNSLKQAIRLDTDQNTN